MVCEPLNKNVIPLSKVVSAAIADTYEDYGRTKQLYSHWAARGYKLLNTQILRRGIKKVLLTVNHNTQTATLPIDFNGEVFVGIIDSRGYKIPLNINTSLTDNASIVDVSEEDKCKVCSQNKNICRELEVTEDVRLVVINGNTYEEKTTKKLMPNGDYTLETLKPVVDIETNNVSYIPQKQLITSFDVKNCGCLDVTTNNVVNLKTYCPDIYSCYYAPCPCNCDTDLGGYKIFEESGLIQFDRYVNFDKVYLEYSGFLEKVKGQYVVPEVAFETLVEWTKYKSIANRKNISLSEKDWQKQNYITEKKNMQKVLGRISLSSIIHAINQLPKFSYGDDWYDCYFPYSQSTCVEETPIDTQAECENIIVGKDGLDGRNGLDGLVAMSHETILFTDVATYDLDWNDERKAKFGDSGSFYVEIVGDDGLMRAAIVDITPDSIFNTTSYHFDFGDISTGRIII